MEEEKEASYSSSIILPMWQICQFRNAWQHAAKALQGVQDCPHGGCREPEVPVWQACQFRNARQQAAHALQGVQDCRHD